MKFKEKTLIAAAILIVMLGLIAGCQQPDNSVGDQNEQIEIPENNDPVFHYSATETGDGSYSLMLTATDSVQQDIKGKVWGLELWATTGENIVPNTGNHANRIADWQEGMSDGKTYYSGMSRATKRLSSGWYALRGSYYESGVEENQENPAPPTADQYSAYSLAPAKSQWHYFKVLEPCTKPTLVAELDGRANFGSNLDDNLNTVSKMCTLGIKLTVLTCTDFKNLTLTGTVKNPSAPLTGRPARGFSFFPRGNTYYAEWNGISTEAGMAQSFIIPLITQYTGTSINIADHWTLKDGSTTIATQIGSLTVQAP